MFICLFVCLFVCWPFFFNLNHLGTPTGIYPENFVKIGLDLADIYRILKNIYLFVCLFVSLLNYLFFISIILRHPLEYAFEISWRSNLTLLIYLGSDKIFICLFVCLFICWPVFYFNNLRTPTGIYSENFVKIGRDLAEILRI